MTTVLGVMAELQDTLQTEFAKSFLGTSYEGDSESVKKLRTKAWQRFLELWLLLSRNEAFQYLRLQKLFQGQLLPSRAVALSLLPDREVVALSVLEECRESCFVFVDGHFVPELSNRSGLPQSLVILPMREAFRTYGALLQSSWAEWLKKEQDPFVALHAACYQDGLFIYVPPNEVIRRPIQLLHIISQGGESEEKGVWMMPRLELFQGSRSEVTLASTVDWKVSCGYFYNFVSTISLEEGAHCSYVQEALVEDVVAGGWFFDTVRTTMKRDTVFKNIQLNNGRALIRRSTRVHLTGEGGDVALQGISFLKEAQEVHADVVIDHGAPRTHSLQRFKTVLDDRARSSFQGKIFVQQQAQKTEAYQLNNNLLLSDSAEANSKPNLEIFADDVKASHGATFGQLSEEEILYLKMRGISEQDAKSCLIGGFCREIIEKVPIASLRESAMRCVVKYTS